MPLDAQLTTILTAVFFVVITALHHHFRITDLRNDMNSRFADVGNRLGPISPTTDQRFEQVDKHFEAFKRNFDEKVQLFMDRIQRAEDNISRQIADHEARIQKLEQRQ